MSRSARRLLAGDIGGTKTNLAIFSEEQGVHTPLVQQKFPSNEYQSLEALVQEFLTRVGHTIDRASFGVAGPVVAGRARTTNLPWVIDEARLRSELKVPSVRLLNDLEAIGWAVPQLEPADLHTLNAGHAQPEGAIAVIAPGTGLGEAFLTWDGAGYRASASEGGHADFAPANRTEIDLLRYLHEKFGHVSWERVCSGRGLPNIYAYLKDRDHTPEPSWLRDRLAAATDTAPVIVDAALEAAPGSELCVATLDLFVTILGSEAGNLALKLLATGGVYLGGGIPPRILPALASERFLEAFKEKGRLSDLLAAIPIHVILNPEAALLGAASYGLQQLDDGRH